MTDMIDLIGLTDLARLPSAADSATFVEAYRKWRADPVGDDATMAAAMFTCFPNDLPDDHERCVTIDGFALVAKREVYQDDSVEYDLEHYALDGNVLLTKPR